MYLVQEYYYMTKGHYRHRKSVYVVFEVAQDWSIRKTATVPDLDSLPQGRYASLPSVEVTPRFFKDVESGKYLPS